MKYPLSQHWSNSCADLVSISRHHLVNWSHVPFCWPYHIYVMYMYVIELFNPHQTFFFWRTTGKTSFTYKLIVMLFVTFSAACVCGFGGLSSDSSVGLEKGTCVGYSEGTHWSSESFWVVLIILNSLLNRDIVTSQCLFYWTCIDNKFCIGFLASHVFL